MSTIASHILLSISLLLMLVNDPSPLRGNQSQPTAGKPVAVTRLRSCVSLPCSYTSTSGIDDPLRLAITDRKAWREVWRRIHRRGPQPVPQLPAINFSKETVLVVGLGSRPTGGYDIFVEGVAERDKKVEVKVLIRSPGKGCMLTQAVTQPVDIVRIAKLGRPIVFREENVVHECH